MEHLLSNGVKFLVFGVAAWGFSPTNAGANHFLRAKEQQTTNGYTKKTDEYHMPTATDISKKQFVTFLLSSFLFDNSLFF